MNIGELIDKMASLDEDVKGHESHIKALKKKKSDIEIRLLKQLSDQKINKASGQKAHARLDIRKHLSLDDATKFNKYIMKHKAFDLYQRRINAKAYFDRLEQGDAPPGVGIFERKCVRITPKRG